jgi:malate dehydrogenase (oxaloacetate-decarboxylating)(NADP+)
MSEEKRAFTDEEVLALHRRKPEGKLSVTPTKPMATQRDLAMLYSPGVAVPVKVIGGDPKKGIPPDPDAVYEFTAKGNLVAVVSNGTAILGLGNLGALASKPVMEGKSVLFKRFADIDSIDIEMNADDAEAVIAATRAIAPTFGGINLEDIKSPECFEIETRLRDELDIPVFHDDQHGTAIVAAAGLINACEITGRRLEDLKVVVSGAGAAGLSVVGLIKLLGVRHDNVILCDQAGVIYRGRKEKMDQYKSAHAVDTTLRTLAEAMEGADCFMGLSVAGIVSQDMIKAMAKNPIVFAMANPDPEIMPEDIKAARSDAIVATGRSDYPNQINNVLGFPYIFRGALDVRARTINEDMKRAAALALAELAKEDVPDEVAAALGYRPKFGPDYVVPNAFDPRLISHVPPYVAQAAMDTGVARKPIADMDAYRNGLAQRLDPTAAMMQRLQGAVRLNPKRIVFAEGEEPSVIRAAYAFHAQGLGQAILIGREEQVLRNMALVGVPEDSGLTILNARLSDHNPEYVDLVYRRLQRFGALHRDAQRLVNQDRNVFAACMVAMGHADGLVTGVTRAFNVAYDDVRRVVDAKRGCRPIGMSIILAQGRTTLIADTNITAMPEAEDIAQIAIQAARGARRFGFTPRVALISYSTFGNPMGERAAKVREAVAMLDRMKAAGYEDIDFEYEGEMSPEVALSDESKRLYPFSRLSEPANVLVMPAIHSAAISTKLLASLGGATVLGPMLIGLENSVQICPLGASVSDIVTFATIAAFDVNQSAPAKG